MSHVLTADSQVAVPQAIRAHLCVQPGQAIDYEPLPDGSVRMVAAPPAASQPEQHPTDMEKIRATLRQWRGKGVSSFSTDEIMRETRGDDWNR